MPSVTPTDLETALSALARANDKLLDLKTALSALVQVTNELLNTVNDACLKWDDSNRTRIAVACDNLVLVQDRALLMILDGTRH